MKVISLQEKYQRENIRVLLEELDHSDLQNIANAFEKIDAIIGDLDNDLPAISGPLDKARQELIDTLSGPGRGMEKLRAIWREFTGRKAKVLQGVLESQIQIVSLFRALPKIMSLSGKGTLEKISQAGGKYRSTRPDERTARPEEGGEGLVKKVDASNSSLSDVLDPKTVQNMSKLIKQALTPAQVSKYPIDANAATTQLMNLSLDKFSELAQRAGGSKIKVPVSPEEAEQIQQKGEENSDPEQEAGGKAQELLQKLAGDPESAKQMKTFLSAIEGMGPKDIEFLRKGLSTKLDQGGKAANEDWYD